MDSKIMLTGDPAEGRSVIFGNLERPHADELTVFRVSILSPGLTAEVSVESIEGDEGYDADVSVVEGSVKRPQLAKLSDFLRDLGRGDTWEGVRTWKSIASELVVAASTDHLGHASLAFEVDPRPWEPSWSAQVRLAYNLGDLVGIGDQLKEWFEIADPSD